MQKILSGRMVRDVEKPHVSFKAYNCIKIILYVSIHSYLNRHIFKWYIEIELELTNAPPPSRGFLTNSPLPGLTRWQIPDKSPRGMGMPGIDWAIIIIIWSKFLFLFIGQEPTMWPANNCLQIMVCSCAMLSTCVWNWQTIYSI